MNSEWTLENELVKLFEAKDISEALQQLGLNAVAAGELKVIKDWHRSGSETYSYVFGSVHEDDALAYRLKACVVTPGARTINEVLSDWICRRLDLASSGMAVPALYASRDGVLLEEEIPFEASDALLSSSRADFMASLIAGAKALWRNGFVPTNGFCDVRSRGADAVFVDFGADLGASHQLGDSKRIIIGQMRDQLRKWDPAVSDSDLEMLSARVLEGRIQ
ncbi:MAG: hypothetical protein ACX930_11520 [Erythrobacter sp.]